MAALSSDRVYKGLWIDYTYGSILGATITTTSTDANIIIAILSILVSFTGAHLWDLIAFVSHWKRASAEYREAYHQQWMVLTRNITSPGAFLLGIVKLGWSWRRQNVWLALCLESTLALICSGGFLIAGIFVSYVVSTTNLQVLVRSDACGFLSWRDELISNQHQEYQNSVFRQALTYTDACYNETTDLPQCNIYVQQRLPIQYTTHTICPFGHLCTNRSALRLDTGLLDSHEMFGINSQPRFGVQMQRVVTCVPLDHAPFFTNRSMPAEYLDQYENGRPVLVGEQLYEWHMGQLTFDLRPFNSSAWQSSYLPMFSTEYYLTPRAYYVDTSADFGHNSTFIPIPDLQHKEADTHLIAIQNNGVHFYQTNDDPLFSAHKKIRLMFDDGAYRQMYTGDNPATFLGCMEQMRFCFTRGGCTPLLGVVSAYNQARRIAPTARQNATLYYLFLQSPTFYSVGRAPMQVTRNLISFQAGVPSHQWEIEVRAWLQFLLAFTQTTITHLAAGPGIVRPDFDQLAQPLPWSELCGSQRMGAPDGFSNINVVGLTFIASFSGLIIGTNLSLVPVLRYLDRRGQLNSTLVKFWLQDGMLQVLRKAYEGMGHPGWTALDTDVPLLRDDDAILLPRLGGVGLEAAVKDCSAQQQPLRTSLVEQTVPSLPPVPHYSDITLSAVDGVDLAE